MELMERTGWEETLCTLCTLNVGGTVNLPERTLMHEESFSAVHIVVLGWRTPHLSGRIPGWP